MNVYPVNRALSALLTAIPRIHHTGLLLDRYVGYPDTGFRHFDQKSGQQPHIDRVVSANNQSSGDANTILADWDHFMKAFPYKTLCWTQTTLWRLAAHLSRASALENASLCLHPLYGFAYLRGEGLKGLAHGYAELTRTSQDDDKAIERIFGTTKKGAGNVLFLEAWPLHWPRLEKDIVNSHHQEYYANEGATPPGDWESPNPTYFIAVAPDVTFRFAVAKQNPDVSDDNLKQAQHWLQEGLQTLGAGAKTAAGYGYFGPATDRPCR